MENKLEQLLNSLIKQGWKPFGHQEGKYGYRSWEFGNNKLIFEFGEGAGRFLLTYSIRDISSIDSGLWQFVCGNGMIKEEHKHERILDPTFGEGWADCKRQEHDGNYGYRLIESSLKDESELEDFLLSNIKVDDNTI